MIFWKWTQGEPYERSRRRGLQQNTASTTMDTIFYDNKVLDDAQMEKQASNAFSIALNHDEYTWDLLNQSQAQTQGQTQGQIQLNDLGQSGFRNVNKREDTDKKLAERQMFANVSMNPYLMNNDYVNDISVQNDFLKPQTTSLERESNY